MTTYEQAKRITDKIDQERGEKLLKNCEERLKLDPLAGEDRARGEFYWVDREAITNLSHILVTRGYKNLVLKTEDGETIEATPTKIYRGRSPTDFKEIKSFEPGTIKTPPFFISIASTLSAAIHNAGQNYKKFSLEVNVDSPFK